MTQKPCKRSSVTPASFSMRFTPTTVLISVVRRFVRALYERLLADSELSSQLALTTHELLENAVKYSSDDEASLAVDVVREANRYLITIRTTNRTTPAHVERLQKIIDELKSADDLFAYFQQVMHETINREDSGLGLARIACETDMSLRLEVHDDSIDIIADRELELERFHG